MPSVQIRSTPQKTAPYLYFRIRYTAKLTIRIPMPDVCAINIKVIVLAMLGKVTSTRGTNTAPVVLLIPVISRIKHADTAIRRRNKTPCTAGILCTPPSGWIYFKNHRPR